ncbi:hypothetical protein, partial [Salmonella sp. SAL4355]|uniref:hypothetical protein n=1 Tax=Salmonella sp. SAL4355 TaxID=3159876 RepID=UPI00397DB18D
LGVQVREGLSFAIREGSLGHFRAREAKPSFTIDTAMGCWRRAYRSGDSPGRTPDQGARGAGEAGLSQPIPAVVMRFDLVTLN